MAEKSIPELPGLARDARGIINDARSKTDQPEGFHELDRALHEFRKHHGYADEDALQEAMVKEGSDPVLVKRFFDYMRSGMSSDWRELVSVINYRTDRDALELMDSKEWFVPLNALDLDALDPLKYDERVIPFGKWAKANDLTLLGTHSKSHHRTEKLKAELPNDIFIEAGYRGYNSGFEFWVSVPEDKFPAFMHALGKLDDTSFPPRTWSELTSSPGRMNYWTPDGARHCRNTRSLDLLLKAAQNM